METSAGMGWKRGHWEIEVGYEISAWLNTFVQTSATSYTQNALVDGTTPIVSRDFVLDGLFLRLAFSR